MSITKIIEREIVVGIFANEKRSRIYKDIVRRVFEADAARGERSTPLRGIGRISRVFSNVKCAASSQQNGCANPSNDTFTKGFSHALINKSDLAASNFIEDTEPQLTTIIVAQIQKSGRREKDILL